MNFKMIVEKVLLEQNFKEVKRKFGDNLAMAVGDKLDPSTTKKYTFKLCEFITDHGDVNDNTFNTQLFNVIRDFDRYNNNNNIEKKDINQYKTFNELNDAINEYKNKLDPRKLAKSQSKTLNEKIIEENKWGKLVLIKDFKDSVKYSGYVDWCVTKEESHFKTYTNPPQDGNAIFVFMIQNGFDKLDDDTIDSFIGQYSMVAIRFWLDGNITYTLRSNDGDLNVDVEKLELISGLHISKLKNKMINLIKEGFKKEEENLKLIYQTSSKGESILKMVDNVTNLNDNFYQVTHNKKTNVASLNGILISPMWFDKLEMMYDTFRVKKNGKYNIMNFNGEILSPNLWFDDVFQPNVKYIYVKEGDKCNFLNKQGEFISKHSWFSRVGTLKGENIIVNISDNYNILNIKHEKYVLDEWYSYICAVGNGLYYKIKNYDGGMNLINHKGDLLLNQWVDRLRMISQDSSIVQIENEQYPFQIENNKATIYKK